MINTYVLSANVTGIALKILYNETYTEASAMLQRVYEIDGYEKNRTKVILATPISVDTSNQEFKLFIDEGCYSGGPVFWGGYLGLNVSRRNYFINYLGVDPGYITEAEYNYVTTTEEYSEMPFWPAAGSVKMIDGYIVIKNKN